MPGRRDARVHVRKAGDRLLESPKKGQGGQGTSQTGGEKPSVVSCRCKKEPSPEDMQIMCNICKIRTHGKCHDVNEKVVKNIDHYRCDGCIIEKLETNDETGVEDAEED